MIRAEQIAARDAILGGNDTRHTRLWLADWIWEEVLEMLEKSDKIAGKGPIIRTGRQVLKHLAAPGNAEKEISAIA